MAQISNYPFLRHLRSEPSRHLMHFKAGKRVRSGRGLAFWFRPLAASVVEVPVDDRDLPFLFHARSHDYQDVVVQGAIKYRVIDAEALANRVDFSIDLESGKHLEDPLQKIADLFTQRAQQLAVDLVAEKGVRELLADGLEPVRLRIEQGLAKSQELSGLGLEVAAVSVASIAPDSVLEQAMQTPALEHIQQQADEAMFSRRALAVDKERAIAENELENQVELAKRENRLIEERGANERRRAEEKALAQAIEGQALEAQRHLEAEGAAKAHRLRASAEADSIALVEASKIEAEESRMDLVRDLPPHVMMGLAAREFAGKLQRIDRLHLAPDSIGPLLSDLLEAGQKVLVGAGSNAPKQDEQPSGKPARQASARNKRSAKRAPGKDQGEEGQ